MDFFSRVSNGWKIAMSSFAVLKKNKQLIIFPVLSGISMVLIMGAIVLSILSSAGWDPANIDIDTQDKATQYLFVFLFYLVNYFIVVFFNMALIHCVKLYLQGEEVSLQAGLKFSFSRIGVIFSWAIFAATVGTILRIIQENSGWIGKIISGFLGIVWGITTFFVVPVIAYENMGPIKAFKRSTELMKQKWGESLAATFSLGLIQFLALLVVAIPTWILIVYVDPFIGIALGLLMAFIIMAIISAAEAIFISLVYQGINGDVQEHFDQQTIDGLFVKKK